MANEYEIGRLGQECAGCGRALVEGEVIVTALIDMPDGSGMSRLDYSMERWDAGDRPDGMIAFWKREVPPADAPARPLVDESTAVGLFEQLEDATEDRQLALRFVLGLMMMRKRLLTFVGQSEEDGRSCMLVRAKGDDPEMEPMRVIDPALDDETIASVTDGLRAVLRLDD